MMGPPLLRFMVLGGLLFIAERAMEVPTAATAQAPITLTSANQRLLLNEARDRLGRPLKGDEAEHILRSWEDETLLIKDAQRLGLEAGDPIVRRRLAEKMRYLLEGTSTSQEPTEAELQATLEASPERFTLPLMLAFEQRFFSRVERGANLDLDAQAALQRLIKGEQAIGDPHPLGEELPLQTSRQLTDSLGATFARAVSDAPVGRWSGPYASPKGLHLIHVNVRNPARPARLEEMRGEIEAIWRRDQRKEAMREQLDTLRARHDLPSRREP